MLTIVPRESVVLVRRVTIATVLTVVLFCALTSVVALRSVFTLRVRYVAQFTAPTVVADAHLYAAGAAVGVGDLFSLAVSVFAGYQAYGVL